MSARDALAAGGYSRPVSSAARMAAMKARFNPSTSAMLSSLGAGGSSEYNFATFDNLLTAINGWFEGLEKLTDQSTARRKLSEEEGSEERVHKVPAVAKQSLKDVVMDDAPHPPPVAEINLDDKEEQDEADSNCSGNSVDRIRPSTPPNLFKNNNEPIIDDEDHEMTPASQPTSPPAKRMEELDIHNPQAVLGGPIAPSRTPNPMGTTPVLTTPTSNPSLTPFADPLERIRSPLTTASNITLPPTPHPIEPISDDKAFTVMKAENIDTQQPTAVSPPTPISEANTVVSQQSTKEPCSSSSASIKKRPKLSRRTILDSLMEKKARNPIYYDGEAQRFFHDLVLEMSQQIQAVKKERRMVMFAKDPACSTTLEKFDKTLQDCLKIVETGSFRWLKGRPDWKEMKEMKEKLTQARKEAEDFKKSGWLPGGDDDSTEDDDDESVDLEI